MDASILARPRRKILCLLFLVLFAQSLAAIPETNLRSRATLERHRRHSRVARTIKSQDHLGRKTKFSYLGPAGINAYSNSTARINGVYLGWIPDAGDTGGNHENMQQIIRSIKGKRPAVFGWYAQVWAGQKFDGNQLFEIMKDLKASKAVFSPAIMPKGSWAGFKDSDDHQAVAIAKVLRKFTDQNIPVIIRFAHEANWYQHTGEYVGTAKDFKEGWAAVARALSKYAPDVLMHWCPNVSDMTTYHKYAPYDMSTVDLVGIDYYPSKKPKPGDFVKTVKEFHDTFAIDGRLFAMGEAGLHYEASYKDRVDWLTQMAQSKNEKELPNLLFINWYNSKKEYNYKIAGDGLSTTLLTERLE